jgi:acetoin utilization deacetylase AcuC-like enzyme
LSDIKIAYDPVYAHPLPEGHRFPMVKYDLIHGQLLHEGTFTPNNFFSPPPCSEEIVVLTHDKEYLDKLLYQRLTAKEQRAIGFPQSRQLIHRELVITQGTIDCCYNALQHGVSLNVAGGTHHAFSDRGEGFCLLNDFAVAANYLLHKKLAKNILIIDLDVHQGNGTADIFKNNKRVFTFSMHGAHNYPFHKENSDWDVPLEDGTSTELYLALLEDALQKFQKEFTPDFAFYLSGVDILETDRFGKLKVTPAGCAIRDSMVFKYCKSNFIPCVVAMAGGYSADIKKIVEAHCNTFRLAASIWP